MQQRNDSSGTQIKDLHHGFADDFYIDLFGAEGINLHCGRLGLADSIRDSHLTSVCQPCAYDITGNDSGHVSAGAVNLGSVFAGEGTAAMGSKTTVGIHHNLSAGQTGICSRTAFHKTTGRIDEDFRFLREVVATEQRIDDLGDDFTAKLIQTFTSLMLHRNDDVLCADRFAIVVFDGYLRLSIRTDITNGTVMHGIVQTLAQVIDEQIQPGENISDFNDALNTLHGSLSYLYNNASGNRYWYDTRPTLRKTAEDRASQVSSADVDNEIETRLKKLRKENPFAGVHICPASSLDVPDEQAVRLVVLRTADTYRRKSEKSKALEAVSDILSNRGPSPRIYKNMLAFVAPDYDALSSLQTEVKRFIAWKSIMSDKDDLNLDGNQIRETQQSLDRSNQTVELRIKETYCWLLVPYIDQFEDMKTIQWEISNIGGGDESIVTKSAKKMVQGEQVITNWAPALLQMSLDDLLWKDSNDIAVKKLWEYLSTYCYLPRLANYSVLEDAIARGLASDEYFALAAAYSNNRYVDLKYNQTVFSINQSDLLVKTNVALKQIVAEKKEEPVTPINPNGGGVQPEGPSGVSPSGGTGTQTTPSGGGATKATNTHFFMSAKLDTTRVNRDVNNYVQEIIQHLMAVDGSDVELTLEVSVKAPDGIPSDVVRTVSENCRTLKITNFGFDE